MTLNDFLKKIDIEKDGDKMLLHCNYLKCGEGVLIGWSNLEVEKDSLTIRLLPCKENSPFSSEK